MTNVNDWTRFFLITRASRKNSSTDFTLKFIYNRNESEFKRTLYVGFWYKRCFVHIHLRLCCIYIYIVRLRCHVSIKKKFKNYKTKWYFTIRLSRVYIDVLYTRRRTLVCANVIKLMTKSRTRELETDFNHFKLYITVL